MQGNEEELLRAEGLGEVYAVLSRGCGRNVSDASEFLLGVESTRVEAALAEEKGEEGRSREGNEEGRKRKVAGGQEGAGEASYVTPKHTSQKHSSELELEEEEAHLESIMDEQAEVMAALRRLAAKQAQGGQGRGPARIGHSVQDVLRFPPRGPAGRAFWEAL